MALLAALALSPTAHAQGFLDNTAAAVGTAPSGTRVVGEDSARAGLSAAPRSAAATCSTSFEDRAGSPVMSAGDALVARISVTNTGGVALTGVRADAGSTPNLPLVLGDDGDRRLELGETWIYRAEATIDQATIDSNGGGTGLMVLPGTVTADGGVSTAFTCELPIERVPSIDILKVADLAPLTETPPRIRYTIQVRNSGNVTLRDVEVTDDLLTPATTICPVIPVGGTCERVGFYEPTPADIAANSVANIATATARDIELPPVQATDAVTVELFDAEDLRLAKAASPRQARRGEVVLFTITVSNDTSFPRSNVRVVDRLPPGLAFREGSTRVNGLRVPAQATGSAISVGPLRVEPLSSLEVTLRASVTAAAAPGAMVNRVVLEDGTRGTTLATATAEVELAPEPVFDCADVIGTVFEDLDRDGAQDEGEIGIPNARVVTVRGVVVTADGFGRFSIPCAALPPAAIGGNFILKLDEESLPRGVSVLSENPRVVRLTPGRVTRMFFAVTALRDVEVQVTGAAFLAGRANLSPAWRPQLDALVEVLRDNPSTLRLTYRGAPSERSLADERLRTLARTVAALWSRAGTPYELEIERRAVLD